MPRELLVLKLNWLTLLLRNNLNHIDKSCGPLTLNRGGDPFLLPQEIHQENNQGCYKKHDQGKCEIVLKGNIERLVFYGVCHNHRKGNKRRNTYGHIPAGQQG